MERDIYDLVRLREFVYNIEGNFYIIGNGFFEKCPKKIKELYIEFIENIKKIIDMYNKKECIPIKIYLEKYKILIDNLKKETFNNLDLNVNIKIKNFISTLSDETKEKIKYQIHLFLYFDLIENKNHINSKNFEESELIELKNIFEKI